MVKMTEKDINKAFLTRLKQLNKKELLWKATGFKIASRVYSDNKFQRNYDTVLYELDRRGLLGKKKMKKVM